MNHSTTVTDEQFEALQGRQRHLILKHDKLFMPGDTLLIGKPDSREQISMEIVSVSKEGINQKGDMSLVGLYGTYTAIDDVKDNL